jgi:hypothetical protein
MKVNIIRDGDGNVVGTFENATPDGASVRPVLPPGYEVHEVEAEENYKADINAIKAFYERHSR